MRRDFRYISLLIYTTAVTRDPYVPASTLRSKQRIYTRVVRMSHVHSAEHACGRSAHAYGAARCVRSLLGRRISCSHHLMLNYVINLNPDTYRQSLARELLRMYERTVAPYAVGLTHQIRNTQYAIRNCPHVAPTRVLDTQYAIRNCSHKSAAERVAIRDTQYAMCNSPHIALARALDTQCAIRNTQPAPRRAC